MQPHITTRLIFIALVGLWILNLASVFVLAETTVSTAEPGVTTTNETSSSPASTDPTATGSSNGNTETSSATSFVPTESTTPSGAISVALSSGSLLFACCLILLFHGKVAVN